MKHNFGYICFVRSNCTSPSKNAFPFLFCRRALQLIGAASVFLAILLSFSSVATASSEIEDNDSAANATSINVNEPIDGNIQGYTDSDWYIVSTPETGYVSFEVTHPVISSTYAYWKMYLYQADGVTPIYGESTYWNIWGNTDKKTAEIGLSAGTYYICIEPFSPDRYDTSTYTLTVNFEASSVWEKEINYSSSTADNIPVNTAFFASICDNYDEDWFYVNTPEDGVVSFEFTHPVISSTYTYWEMYLYQADGVTPIYGESNYWNIQGNSDLKTAEIGLSAGTYYICIEPVSADRYDTSTYTLTVNFESSPVWEKEINNSPFQASIIPVNTDFYSSICGRNDKDWFSFNLGAPSDVSITFNHSSNTIANTYWEIEFYTADGVTELHDTVSVSGNNTSTMIDLGRMEKGDYYIAVFPYSSDRYDTSTYSVRINEKHDHVYGDWVISLEPTCTESGIQEHSCTICGYTVSESIPPNGHSWGEWQVDKDSTCAEDGSRHRVCEICGYSETERIEKKPHVFGDWHITEEPSCSEAGTKQRVCNDCGYIESAELEKTQHEYGEKTRVSGNIFFAPIVSEQKCKFCKNAITTENWDYEWVMPLSIILITMLFLLFLFVFLYKHHFAKKTNTSAGSTSPRRTSPPSSSDSQSLIGSVGPPPTSSNRDSKEGQYDSIPTSGPPPAAHNHLEEQKSGTAAPTTESEKERATALASLATAIKMARISIASTNKNA